VAKWYADMLREYKIVSVNSCVSAHHRIYPGNLANLASQAFDFGRES